MDNAGDNLRIPIKGRSQTRYSLVDKSRWALEAIHRESLTLILTLILTLTLTNPNPNPNHADSKAEADLGEGGRVVRTHFQ